VGETIAAGAAGGDERVADALSYEGSRTTDAVRSVAQLNMLHSLAAELNSLADVAEIANAITAELRTIIDYHNCRVYLLQPDGTTLVPIAFRGELFSEYETETYEELVTKVGEGITGHVAATRTSLLTPDARDVEFAVQIPGTDDILESILAVPMLVGDEVVGAIVLSSLGYGKFDEDDRRLLEVLASHAAIAFQNAKLFQGEREAAETSTALLGLAQALPGMLDADDILRQALETIPGIVPSAAAAAYLRDAETGSFHLQAFLNVDLELARDPHEVEDIPTEIAEPLLASVEDPFLIPREIAAGVPDPYRWATPDRDVLVAPLRFEPDGFGALAMLARDSAGSFGDRDLRLAKGIADIASLALGNARRMSELERFHELVESLDAVFWEADRRTLRLTFLSRRATRLLGIGDPVAWVDEGHAWGEHIREEDRAASIAACHAVVEAGDQSIEYRLATPDGRAAWVRDLVHASRGRDPGAVTLRGLMVDITERKRAEQALRRSERKYSEAFRREREAAQRLRALDEMKNTFLEAVSHDLRTPLTSILGSALTLEQTEDLPRDDAVDLVRRIAANARKLERLLSDLLDLDRLQRGIVTPQRRPTDVGAVVRRVAEEVDAQGRAIEVEAGSVVVAVDAAKLERILENLLSNAIRHTPTGSRIWVRAEPQDGGVLIAVDDEGPGIPEDTREEIFEPFRQLPGSASEHSPGVGVGLSLVRRFAELHGGRAWVDARPAGGSSFRVLIPGG
jgi:PAS domain S-box-containing protein